MTTNRRTFLKGISAAGAIRSVAPALLPMAGPISAPAQTGTSKVVHVQTSDSTGPSIYFPPKSDALVQKAVDLLQQRIQQRSDIHVSVTEEVPGGNGIGIVVGVEHQLETLQKRFRNALGKLPPTSKEGYKITSLDDGKTILIAGNDPHGALYGAGFLLRKMELRNKQIVIPSPLAISSSPRFWLRGQHLTYRFDKNSSPQEKLRYEQYLQDLICFGLNNVLVLTPEEAQACMPYGLRISIDVANVQGDFVTPQGIEKELAKRDRIFRSMPHLDEVFVPGGDPGDLDSNVLFNWLEKLGPVLQQSHPGAKIWVSPQNNNQGKATEEWYDTFYERVNRNYSWLGGVVFGPWVRTPIEKIRKIVRRNIPIERYPDITHLIQCQYPAPHLDLAFADTLGRMSIQPRPNGFKHIHNLFAGYAIGSRPYSEGNSDDVNKFVWTAQDWDPGTPVVETLRDYARLFISPDHVEGIVQGLFGLEENLIGPLISNRNVQKTLFQWQDLEKKASSDVLKNPRFQMGLVRAYYDAYQQQRMVYETFLEDQACGALQNAKNSGSAAAMEKAKEILSKAQNEPAASAYKAKVQSLYGPLYRGPAPRWMTEIQKCEFVEHIDVPLNNSEWLIAQFNEIQKAPSESERLQQIDTLLHRTDPGAGGFYDNMGSAASFRRVISKATPEEDPGTLIYPRRNFYHGTTPVPNAWKMQMATLYDIPLVIAYDTLDPHSSYRIRVNYTGIIGRGQPEMKLVANKRYVIHDFIDTVKKPIQEFPIPQEAVKTGRIEFAWTCGKGERGSPVAEVWLIKQSNSGVSADS